MTDRPTITIDPAQRFGQPCVGGSPTHIVAGSVRGGMSFDDVAEDYDLTRHQVVLACWYEGSQGQYREVWRSWAESVAPGLAGHEEIDIDRVQEPPQKGGIDA